MGGEIIRRLLGSLEKAVEKIPDSRKGSNKQYRLGDVIKSAFAVFFFQFSSILAFQRKMEDEFKQNNARTILGIGKIPGDTQIRNLLDEIEPANLSSVFHDAIKTADDLGVLKDYRVLDGGVLIAIDGLWYHASEKVHCAHCLHITKDGVTTYYHSALAAAIVRPDSGFVLPLMGELITNEDGERKQDCELKAATRWLEKHAEEYKWLRPTLLGDDLYAHEPFCALILEHSMSFIFTCKDSTHKWLTDTVKNSYLSKKTESKWTGRKKMMYIYRFINHVPIKYEEKDGNNLFVNYFSLEIKEAGSEKSTFKSWITDKTITDDNVVAMASSARARWKIENEHHNVLKNRGYNLEHNFGHGEKHASEIFFLLNILSFQFHTILEYADEKYQRARAAHYTRKVFFEILRSLMILIVFDSWDHLLDYMTHEHHEIKPIQPG